MRFYFIYLSLLIVKYTIASNLIYKRENDINWDNYEDCDKISIKGCEKIIEEGYDKVTNCLNKINETCKLSYLIDEYNINDVCDNWQSPQCQNLIDKNSKNIPECNNFSNSFSNSLDEYLNSLKALFNPICSKDEYGNYCPMSSYFLDDVIEEQKAIDLINNNCNSENCRKVALESYESILRNLETDNNNDYLSKRNVIVKKLFNINNNKRDIFKRQFIYNSSLDEVSQLKQIVEYLKSDNCIAQTKKIFISSNAFSLDTNFIVRITILIVSILSLNI